MSREPRLPMPDRCSLYQALLWVAAGVRPIEDDIFYSVPLAEDIDVSEADKHALLLAMLARELNAQGIYFDEDEPDDFIPPEKVPVDVEVHGWDVDSLDMENGEKRCHPSGVIKFITVSTNALMKVFPPEGRLEPSSATSPDAKNVVEQTEQSESKRSGRPRKYNWEAFYVEIAVKADLDGLPETQAGLVRDMAEWCQKTWGEEPVEATLKKRISPIYQHHRKAKK